MKTPICNRLGFKVFESDADGRRPKTLFHGWRGSRILPIDRVLEAERKRVRSGSNAPYYQSGWHLFESLKAVKQWSRRINQIDSRYVVPVKFAECGADRRANGIIVTPAILISQNWWSNRFPLGLFLRSFEGTPAEGF